MGWVVVLGSRLFECQLTISKYNNITIKIWYVNV